VIAVNGTMSLINAEYSIKLRSNILTEMTGAPFTSNDTSKGVFVYYSGTQMYIVYRFFNSSNPQAM
jgi:hypothetical protein